MHNNKSFHSFRTQNHEKTDNKWGEELTNYKKRKLFFFLPIEKREWKNIQKNK